MRIGEMNQRISLVGLPDESTSDNPDDYTLHPTMPEPEVLRTCWAKVEHEGMKDYQTAVQNNTEKQLTFHLRQWPHVTNKMLVRFQGKDLPIEEIVFDYEEKRFMTIITKGVEA